MTTRAEARAAAIAALNATGSYTQVYGGPPDDFGGQSPVAVVMSRTAARNRLARDYAELAGTISVTIYVRREPGQETAVEAQLDDLVEEALAALADAGLDLDGSESSPDGAALRVIDGSVYRVERIIAKAEEP